MWTFTGGELQRKANGDGIWTPNHFTYIHEKKNDRSYITIDHTEDNNTNPEAKPSSPEMSDQNTKAYENTTKSESETLEDCKQNVYMLDREELYEHLERYAIPLKKFELPSDFTQVFPNDERIKKAKVELFNVMSKPKKETDSNPKQSVPKMSSQNETPKSKQGCPDLHTPDNKKERDFIDEWEHAKATRTPKELNEWLLVYSKNNPEITVNELFTLLQQAQEKAKSKQSSPMERIKKFWDRLTPDDKETELMDEDEDFVGKDFLTFNQAFRHVESRYKVALEKLPPGLNRKTNFVIKNTNLKRYEKGKAFKHPRCDAGAFKKPSSKAKVWERVDSATLKLRRDLGFDVKRRVITKNESPIDAEKAKDFYVSKEVWGQLKRDKRYKRKITYILETPDSEDYLRNV